MAQYYAEFDASGHILAFYNDDVWDVDKIPSMVVPITEEQWKDAVSEQGKYVVQNGEFCVPTEDQRKKWLAIQHLYPTAVRMVDFVVQDDLDGKGAYIARWDLDALKPTDEELQAALEAMQPKESDDSIEQKKTEKLRYLDKCCSQAITGTFLSSAVGEMHEYSYDLEAQINMHSLKELFATDPALKEAKWNTRDAGVIVHTKDQFSRLWTDGMMHKIAQLDKLRFLESKLQAASSSSEIEQIKWS